MSRLYPFLTLLLLLLTGCGGDGAMLPQDSFVEGTLTPLATRATSDVPISEEPGGIARAYFHAWETGDYLGMYSLLSSASQSLVDTGAFVQRYEEAMETAVVTAIISQPLSLVQEGAHAEYGTRVTWQTAVVGDIVREYDVQMVYENGRWGIVWNEGLILPELAGGNRLSMKYRVPARANIYDRNGLALAYQGNILTLGVVPGDIEDEAGMLNALAPLLNKSAEEIKSSYAVAQPDWYWPIGDVTETQLQEHIAELQPFIDRGLAPPSARLTRLFSEAGSAPHIIGYTGGIPAEEAEAYAAAGYRGDEIVGLAGLELWGEDILNGERGGTLTAVNSNGNYVATVQEKEPRQARSIYTTLDREFQTAVEASLAEALAPLGTQGAIVVMDVNSGDILAMASYPSYDPNIFDKIRPEAANELGLAMLNEERPLLNRATQGIYPAGSIFKIITTAAGYKSGLYTPETRYTSTGTWNRIDGYPKYDWRAGGHGTVSMKTALIVSCNSCFYDMGFNVNNEVDPYLLPNTAREFGLGVETGIQIPEAAGTIPDPTWKMENVGEGWVPGDAVNMAIGQGFVQVSPLQVVNFTAAVANGGTLYTPSLIDRIGAGAGAPEEEWPATVRGRLPFIPEYLTSVQESMWSVANNLNIGTAAFQFTGMPIEMAGKTGTAEAPPGFSHAWFTGYAPAAPYTRTDGTVVTEPEIAITIIAEHAGEGSAIAAPIFRRVVELYYDISPKRPFGWAIPINN